MHARYGERLLSHILSPVEKEAWQQQRINNRSPQILPLWFAVKEAVYKAASRFLSAELGTSQLRMCQIQVMDNLAGKRKLNQVLHLSSLSTLSAPAKKKAPLQIPQHSKSVSDPNSNTIQDQIYFFLAGDQDKNVSVGSAVCILLSD